MSITIRGDRPDLLSGPGTGHARTEFAADIGHTNADAPATAGTRQIRSYLKGLAPAPSTYRAGDEAWARDAGGEVLEVRAGVLDGAAEDLYLNGQCLALASAMSVHTGWPVVVSLQDDTTDDDAGDRLAFLNLAHAYVMAPNGSLIDITGDAGDIDSLVASHGELEPSTGRLGPLEFSANHHVHIYDHEDAADLVDLWRDWLEEQDEDLAASFVTPAMDQWCQQNGNT